jgi:hypothetical protein
MGRRVKQLVKKRAKAHAARVKSGHKRRVRSSARGFHPASSRRRKRREHRKKK